MQSQYNPQEKSGVEWGLVGATRVWGVGVGGDSVVLCLASSRPPARETVYQDGLSLQVENLQTWRPYRP
jgi:hypothetical protein